MDLMNSRNKRFLSPSKAVVMELSRESEGMATPPAFFHWPDISDFSRKSSQKEMGFLGVG